MKTIMTVQSFLWFAVYFVSGIGMLAIFTRLYIYITPYDEQNQIKAGKKAPAIALVGAMLGFTIPIVSMSYHGAQFLEYIIWSVIAGMVQLVCFKIIYWMLPRQIESDNVAAAVFYAGAAMCVGTINAFSLVP